MTAGQLAQAAFEASTDPTVSPERAREAADLAATAYIAEQAGPLAAAA